MGSGNPYQYHDKHRYIYIYHGCETISRRYRKRSSEIDVGGVLILGLFVAVYYIFKYWQWTLALIFILGSIGLVYYLNKRSKKKSINDNPYNSESAFRMDNHQATQIVMNLKDMSWSFLMRSASR
ncbi:MAG: hypothetical protein H5T43_03735 [Methanomethylovorans sp.]|jgi:uncharacterized protein YneF (UPF0154 family)|nr:hypothetical protein [Methanomethylovorans sp.]